MVPDCQALTVRLQPRLWSGHGQGQSMAHKRCVSKALHYLLLASGLTHSQSGLERLCDYAMSLRVPSKHLGHRSCPFPQLIDVD